METPKAPTASPKLSITPATFEIVLAEESSNPLAFVSPPITDISEMADLERSAFSLSRGSHEILDLEQGIKERLDELLLKAGRFSDSSVFHNRIANLHRALGNLTEEIDSLSRATAIDDGVFLKRKLSDGHLRGGNEKKAHELLLSLADGDAFSALRLASIYVLNNDLESAERWVDAAVRLEPEGYAERLFQGGIKLFKGQFIQAIRFFRMAIEARPGSSVAYSNLAIAHLGTGNVRKSFDCFKRAVALDPFNRSAVLALADVGHVLERDSDVVPSLRYFLQFEQREPATWGRMARSLLAINAIDECIDALKRQGAFEKSTSVWNNLGVAYAMRGQKEQSLQAFKYALTVEANGGSKAEMVVARNTAQLISTLGKPQLLFDVTSSLIGDEIASGEFTVAADPQLCDIYGFHISALIQVGKKNDAIVLAKDLLQLPNLGEPLAKWIFQSLTGILGLDVRSFGLLNEVLDLFMHSEISATHDINLINNISFALAEVGRLEEAEKLIRQSSFGFHKNAYLTATLGLINFRKGRHDRGEALYKEAISLALKPNDKVRIRQKLNLEIGRALARSKPALSRRAFEKVIKEKQGENQLVRQARLLLEGVSKEGN